MGGYAGHRARITAELLAADLADAQVEHTSARRELVLRSKVVVEPLALNGLAELPALHHRVSASEVEGKLRTRKQRSAA